MDKLKSTLDFRLMALAYKVRDLLSPRINVLKEADIKPGFRVLDYGCGPGSYILPLAELVGDSGEIYALDINPLALRKVQSIASKRGLKNVKTIKSDCATGLQASSMDVVLFYDTSHDLSQPGAVLRELHRVLKPNGALSFSDHHMKEQTILLKLTDGNLFILSEKGRKTYSFLKQIS